MKYLFGDMQVTIHTDNETLMYIWSRGLQNPCTLRLTRASVYAAQAPILTCCLFTF